MSKLYILYIIIIMFMTQKIFYNNKVDKDNVFVLKYIDNKVVYYDKVNDIVIVNDIVNVFDKDNDKVINDFDFDFVKEYINKNIVKDNVKVNEYKTVKTIKDIKFDFDNDIVKVINIDNDIVINDNDIVIVIDFDLFKVNEYKLRDYFKMSIVFYEYDNSIVYCLLKDNNTLKYVLKHLNYRFYDLSNIKSINNYKKSLIRLCSNKRPIKDTLINKGQIIDYHYQLNQIKNYLINNDNFFVIDKNIVNDIFKSFKGQKHDKDIYNKVTDFINKYNKTLYKNKNSLSKNDKDNVKEYVKDINNSINKKYHYKFKDNVIDYIINIDIDNDKDNVKDNVKDNDIVKEYNMLKKVLYRQKNDFDIKFKVNSVYVNRHNTLRYNNTDNDIDKVIDLYNKVNDFYKKNKDIINKNNVKGQIKNQRSISISLKSLYNDFLNDIYINDYDFNLTIKVYNHYLTKINDIVNDINYIIDNDLINDKELLIKDINMLNTVYDLINDKKSSFIEIKNYKELYDYKNNDELKYHNAIHKVNKINFEKVAYDENKSNFVTID